jgi:HPt (histidine-containing phosphotransfer) domain-containing protein
MTVFDRGELLQRLEGDEAFLREMVSMFLEDAPETLDGLRAAMTAGDAGEIRRFSHSLKGAAANISGSELRDAALAAEKAGAEGDPARAAELLPEIEAAMERLRAALDRES